MGEDEKVQKGPKSKKLALEVPEHISERPDESDQGSVTHNLSRSISKEDCTKPEIRIEDHSKLFFPKSPASSSAKAHKTSTGLEIEQKGSAKSGKDPDVWVPTKKRRMLNPFGENYGTPKLKKTFTPEKNALKKDPSIDSQLRSSKTLAIEKQPSEGRIRKSKRELKKKKTQESHDSIESLAAMLHGEDYGFKEKLNQKRFNRKGKKNKAI